MKKKVLTVDDEYQMRDFISTLLEENDYIPLQAKNGEEAMTIIKKEKPDLIILDVLMPEKGGIKFYRELKTSDDLKGIPVIICSGIARRTFIRSKDGHGRLGGEGLPQPEAYIEKPVKPATLAKALKELLG